MELVRSLEAFNTEWQQFIARRDEHYKILFKDIYEEKKILDRRLILSKSENEVGKYIQRRDNFLVNATREHNGIYSYVLSHYVKNCIRIWIVCNEHQHAFQQRPDNHRTKGTGCEKCQDERKEKERVKEIYKFVRDSTVKYNGIYLYFLNDYISGEYISSDIDVRIWCTIHKIVFLKCPGMHKYSDGCYKCGKLKQQSANIRSFNARKESFIPDSIVKHDGKYTYPNTDYQGGKEKVEIECPHHGAFWQIANDHVNQGKGCWWCAIENRDRANKEYSIYCGKFFPVRSTEIHKGVYKYHLVRYLHDESKVEIYCTRCNNVFSQTPHNHLRGHGCSLCIRKTECIVYEFLKSFCDVQREVSFRFSGRSKYDFQVGNILIELDGPQHFRQILNWKSPKIQFEKDVLKMQVAHQHDFKMIRLLQEDVLFNRCDWKTFLISVVQEFPKNADIVFLHQDKEYDNHASTMKGICSVVEKN